MTCFFDAAHGPGMQTILWTPQWGAARNVTACPACAQRWLTYQQQMAAGQPGYPAPQPGYPQAGYPAQPGYPAAGYPHAGYDADYDHHHRRGPGWAGVAAAGAAGLVGGALINEMLDDDEPRQQVVYEVTNNEYVTNNDYNDYSDNEYISDDSDDNSW
ncbi:hypothetical protein [Actinomadura gamaensis]|uniref:Uncharacterized protein n=1 Tax=Actinomadura gamaensis TaxID=1763541 RepID=A0ABV9TYA5_9ACTN